MPWPRSSHHACLSLLVAVSAAAHERPAPARVDVAPGVYLFRTEPYGPLGLDGNSVAVIGADAVLVFDTNGTPAAAEAVLREIRTLTDRPVRWIVTSHWHWDHWYGTEVYQRAFPEAVVVAHEKTRALMAGPAIAFNRPGLETQLPDFLDMLERRLAEPTTAPSDAENLRAVVAEGRFFLDQKRSARLVLPALTFSDRLEIHLGDRVVQVLNVGRAVTPGDAFLFLPEERILVTGDLLIDPVTFALGVFPTEWLEVLEHLDALDAAVLVPGHGAPMHDEAHLHATMDALRTVIRLGREAKRRGVDVDVAREEMRPTLRDVRLPITRDDPAVNEAFEMQFVDWLLHRVYEEMDGPLSDAIAPIPVH